VANTFIKATRIASAALGLLEREIVLPGLVWRDAGGDFRGAGGDTISIRVPARTQARTRALRGARPSASEGDGIISMDALTETKVDVTLDTAVYSAVPVTDEELTLDLTDFGAQILEPQVRAVAEGIENAVAAEMTGATYATNLTVDTADPFKTFVDAYTALNKANIPREGRAVVVGADIENLILKSDHLSRVDQSGSDAALRRAEMGRLAGFPIYVSNAIPANMGSPSTARPTCSGCGRRRSRTARPSAPRRSTAVSRCAGCVTTTSATCRTGRWSTPTSARTSSPTAPTRPRRSP
jgi:hypothetical protein